MQVPLQGSKALSQNQLWLVFLVALGMHVLPLVLADFAYMDDIWRSLVAGRVEGKANSWAAQGRVLVDWLYAGLSGTDAAPDLFPLPLLLALVVVARAFAALTLHYFERPDLSHGLVILALWFNPFFLQNLSYQYDAPAMALTLAACVWAITSGAGSLARCVLGSVLIAIALSLYQPSINVFAILCCVEVLHQAARQARLARIATNLAMRLAQLLAGCLLYRLTAYRLLDVPRTAMLPVDVRWPGEMLARLQLVTQDVALLATPANTWLIVTMLILALAGVQLVLRDVMAGPGRANEKLGIVLLVLLALAVSLLMVPGMVLLFASFNHGARLLMGFGGLLLVLALLARRALVAMHPRLAWGLAIPMLLLLSLSFAYGRVLVLQKDMHQRVLSSLAGTLESNPRLQDVTRFHLHLVGNKGPWLPAASGTLETLPVLRKVLNIRFWLLPESAPRVGLDGFYGAAADETQRLLAGHPQAVVETRLYAIYLVNGEGHVVMKPPHEPEHLFP